MAGVRALTDLPLALFRCDAAPRIGAGHVTRCLALAEVLSATGWQVAFAVGPDTTSSAPSLATSGFRVRVLNDENQIRILSEMASGAAALLVVDHYDYDRSFERTCRSFAHRIMVFDDATGRDHDCDILVDAAAPDPAVYAGHVPPQARVLAGPAYALVRPSFVAQRQQALARHDGRPVKEILVSCGATDPANATALVLDALDGIMGVAAVTVVLSSRAPNVDSIRKRSRGNTQLLVDVESMAELMTRADLAVGAPGATSYERAVLGLPSIVVTLADNQRGMARMLAENAAALDAGSIDDDFVRRLRHLIAGLLKDDAARRKMAQAASALVDGRGPMRIMLGMLDDGVSKDGAQIRLRVASLEDEGWLFDLQTHPQTRRYFRNAAAPGPEEHRAWLQKTLPDGEKQLLIIEVDGTPVGNVRLDRLSDRPGANEYELSIVINQKYHGRGIGSSALRFVRKLMPGATIDATVLPENRASRALFEGSGYVAVSDDLYRSVPAALPALNPRASQGGSSLCR